MSAKSGRVASATHRVLRRALLAAAAMAIACFATASARPAFALGREAAGSTTVRGTVVNQSTMPHRPVAGLPVALLVKLKTRVVDTVNGRTDAHGNFALPAPLPRGGTYAVETTYKGVQYDLDVDAAHGATGIRIPVYNVTSSDSGLAAMKVVIGSRRRGQGLSVIEDWIFANAGPAIDVGADAAGRYAARFPLPPQATHVRVVGIKSAGGTASVQNGGVVLNAILRPATGMNAASFHEIVFTFDLPSAADHPTLLIPTRYFIGSLNVFAVGSRVVAPGFTQTTLAAGNTSVPAFQTQAVAPGSTVAVGIDGAPEGLPSAPLTIAGPTFPTAGVAVMVELGFGALVLLALFGRGFARATPTGRQALRQERDRLVDEIADLDLLYSRGAVTEVEYRRKRSGEKRRLLTVARQLGE